MNTQAEKKGPGNGVSYLVKITAVAMSLFHIYTGTFGLMMPTVQRSIHLAFASVLIAFLYPIKFKNKVIQNISYVFFILYAAFFGFYTVIKIKPALLYKIAVQGPSTIDLLFGVAVIILVLEATRRVSGNALPILGLIFIGYALLGGDLPGVLSHKGYSWREIVDFLIYSQEGLYGMPLGVSATFVALFILFGATLEVTGCGKWFIDIAYALAGHTRSGPAMTAVVSSAVMGTISGVGVANVVTTGAFTIPLMKSCGYKPPFAGAVEATASTGGQIMPPVMGAAAFIMAEMMGVPYGAVALAALIPAIMYYAACGVQVHLEACRLGMKGLPKEELPPLGATFMAGIVYLIPIAVLIWALVIKFYTATLSALYGMAAVLLVSFLFKRKKEGLTVFHLIRALETGAKNMLPVATACSTAGLIIGIVLKTGLALKFTALLINMAGGQLFFVLLLTMICCIFLGMGLPTSASYIITATLGVPALIKLGVSPMAANLFVLYFACLSAITPPVALAAYAASGIANASPMQTGLQATKLGIAGFVVPFMFVYGPSLLMEGSLPEIILASFTAIIGTIFLAIGVEGYLFEKLRYWERTVFIAAALTLVKPGLVTDLVGLLLGAFMLLYTWSKSKKARVNAAGTVG